ncbi:MAG: hypothetical protein ACRDOK_29250 [Streptosporangiaceae bacterium]
MLEPPDQVLIAWRQRAGSHQHAAQVLHWFAVGQLVESGVGQCSLPCREFAHDRRGGVLVQPGQHGVRPLVAGEVLVQGLKLRADLSGVVAQQLTESLLQRAAAAAA